MTQTVSVCLAYVHLTSVTIRSAGCALRRYSRCDDVAGCVATWTHRRQRIGAGHRLDTAVGTCVRVCVCVCVYVCVVCVCVCVCVFVCVYVELVCLYRKPSVGHPSHSCFGSGGAPNKLTRCMRRCSRRVKRHFAVHPVVVNLSAVTTHIS